MKHGLFLTAMLFAAAPATAGEFIVVGDLPYNSAQEVTFREAIAPAIVAADVPFVIHAGDIKGSKEVCSDALLIKRRDAIYALKPGRVFYTPGDNEWTDCDRDSSGLAMREYDRLDRLRVLFFDPAPEPPEALPVVRQEGYPENARWWDGESLFLTLHIVGTNNGRRQILLDDVDDALARVDARDAANAQWLDAAVAEAMARNAQAMIVAAQADLTEPWGSGPCTASKRQECDAFADIRDRLVQAATTFGKPVLYIHGDTDPYCLDRTFGGEAAPNLWRLNGAGDYAVIDAVRVTVSPGEETPFKAATLLDGVAPTDGC
ncbi:MAG: hypothetical protein VX464_18035 [Pseudomonadota bacterium]|nr:hypothetical protein [Pseudomonadota bacterium]